MFTSDKDDALLKAGLKVFPSVPQLVCCWHVERNIKAHAKDQLKREILQGVHPKFIPPTTPEEKKQYIEEVWQHIRNSWLKVRSASTEQQYNDAVESFKITSTVLASFGLFDYINNEWLSCKKKICEA
jgi:transposase-like protein